MNHDRAELPRKRRIVMTDIPNKKSVDTEHSLSAVDAASRQGFWAVLVVLVGFTFFSPSMTAGGNLGIGLNMRDFFIAMTLGNAFLGVYTGALAYIGQRTGLTLDRSEERRVGKECRCRLRV